MKNIEFIEQNLRSVNSYKINTSHLDDYKIHIENMTSKGAITLHL